MDEEFHTTFSGSIHPVFTLSDRAHRENWDRKYQDNLNYHRWTFIGLSLAGECGQAAGACLAAETGGSGGRVKPAEYEQRRKEALAGWRRRKGVSRRFYPVLRSGCSRVGSGCAVIDEPEGLDAVSGPEVLSGGEAKYHGRLTKSH